MATDSFDNIYVNDPQLLTAVGCRVYRNLIPMETSLQNSVLADQVMDNLQIQNILQWIRMEMFTLVIGSNNNIQVFKPVN